MSPQDDSNRDSVQSYAEWWTAKSLFTGEAAEEPAPVVNEWYQANAPFLEGRELQEMYGSEAEEEDYPTELEDEEPDEEAYEPTYEALLYQEALAGENEYSITQSVGTERLLQEHFDSLIGEAKALLDEMASDLRRYDFADMSEAEIEALLNQYQLVGTPHHQGFEYLLNDVQDMAKRLLRGTVNLTRPQTRQAGFQPISSFQYTFEREQKQTVQQYQLNTTGAKRYTTADGLFYRFPVGRHHKNNIKRPQFQHPESSMVTYKGAGASREEVKIHPAVSTALHNLMSALRAEGTRINDESMKLAVVASGFRAPTEAEGRRYLQALKKTIAQNPTIFGALTFPSNLENMARSELGSGGAPAFIAFRNAIASRQGWNGRLADQLLSITGGFKAPRGASTHHSGLAVDINFPYVTSDSKVQRHSMNRERNSDAFRAAAGVWLNAYAPAFGFDTYNTKKEIWHQEWRNWGGTPADPASQQPREQEEIVEPEVEEPGEFITELAGEEFDEAVEERIAQEAFADFLADEEELENISSGKEAYIPASRLQWPEASQQQREFMRRVYEKQVRRAVRKRPFRGDVPEAELGFIEEGHKARIKAATACRALLAAARTALDQQKREGLKQAQKVKSIYALSAYRSASEQFSNWQGNFPRYYQDTRANRAAQEDGEHGEAAAEYLARYIGRRLAAPGFSLHNSGLAVDFGTIEGKRRLGASTSASSISQWKQSWLFRWLTENAPTFNYYQNRSIEEPWHWEHGKPAEDASQETLLEQEAEEEALGGFVADEEEEQETEEFLDEQYAQEAGTASATVPSPTSPITSQLSKGSVFQQLQEALHRGAWSLAIGLALLLGVRDVNKLTDMVYFAQHPRRQGQRLRGDEHQEWLRIRDHLVRPALQKSPPTLSVPSPTAPPPPASLAQRTLSGAHWVSRFPGSKDVNDLEPTFRAKVERFIAAIEDAGGTVTVTSTYRPPERAYLMHWSWRIVKDDYPAQKVPLMARVDIEWWHGDAAKSKQAAQEMVDGYGIESLKVAPSLTSRHIQRKALDMHISWRGNLQIKNADGIERIISSSPRNETNAELIEVGKTYGVIHFTPVKKDKVHWSTDGK